MKAQGISRRAFLKGAAASAGALTLGGLSPLSHLLAQDEVALRWAMWAATTEERAVWEELAADVTALYPNVTVNLETIAFGQYWDQLQTQLVGGTEADIVAMQSLRMPGFAVRNALRPLNELIDGDPDFEYEDFFTSIQDGLSFNGNVYAFSYDVGPYVLFYNKNRFDELGIPYPSATDPMSWDDFQGIAQQMTNPDANQYGFSFFPSTMALAVWLWGNGADYMNVEETLATLDAPEAIEALEFIASMTTVEGGGAPITDLGDGASARQQFFSGNVGMYTDGVWQFINTRNNVEFDWDIAPVPAGAAGSIAPVAGSGFGISNTTQHLEEAWAALKAITSFESLSKTAAAGRGYPGRRSAVSTFIDPSLPPANVVEVNNIIDAGRFFRTTTTWQETDIMIAQNLYPVFVGQGTVQEAIASVMPLFNELLTRHQELLNT